MKVICIGKIICDEPEIPKVGNPYNVDDSKEHFMYGLYHHLVEFPGDKWWNADKFVPTSEIDEETFERNYQKETA